MKKYIFSFIIHIIMLNSSIYGYFDNVYYTARSLGAGNTGISGSSGVNAIFFNPANTFFSSNNCEILFSFNKVYSVDEIGDYSGGIAYKYSSKYIVSIGFNTRYIENIYTQSLTALGIASKYKNLNYGILLKYYYFNAKGYSEYNDPNFQETTKIITFDIGISYKCANFWKMGIVGYNLNSPEYSLISTTDEKDKFFARIGYSNTFVFRKFFSFSVDLQNQDEDWKKYSVNLGMEIWFFDAFALRSGVENNNITLGFGLQSKKWNFDAALLTNEKLGNLYRLTFILKL